MIAWTKSHLRGLIVSVLLLAVVMAAMGFSGSQQTAANAFSAPTGVAATSAGDTITVTWTPGGGAASQVIVAVNVLDDTDYCLGFDATGSAASHECPGLSGGVTYLVLVIALDGAGGYRLGRDGRGNLVTHTLLSESVSQEVAAGVAATVTHDSGAQIDVPAGALRKATTVSIAEVHPPATDIDVGRVFDFSVGDVELSAPVELRIPYRLSAGQPAELLYAVHWDENAGEWERVEAEVDAATGTVVVSTTDLSRFSYGFVSVDATCSVDRDRNDANHFTVTARITSRTLFGISVYMAPEVRETTRNATFFDQSDVRSVSRTLSRNATRSFSESFSLRYLGDYEARCRIFWEILGTDVELRQRDDTSIDIGVSQNAAPERDGSKLNECSSSYVDQVTGKTTRSFANERTVLQGESLGFRANGFAYGEDKIFTPFNTPHLVSAIVGYYRGELLDKSIGRKKAVYKGYSSIPLAETETPFTFSEVGEYTVDCVLWWFVDDPKIPDFKKKTEESIKDLLRCIRDGAACLGYLKALRDVRTVTVTAVPSLWSQRPMEIIPAGGVPHDSPDSRATVRIYTRETTATGHVIRPPTIVLNLTENLGLTTLPRRHSSRASTCGTRGADFCWEATFDMPFNPARATLNDDGSVTPNNLVYAVSISAGRHITGRAPSGTLPVLSKPPFSSDREILGTIYNATSGSGWSNRTGWTSSGVDVEDWHGVAVDSDNRVSRLELGRNNLRGDLPEALGFLTGLQHLDLSRNRLRGEMPARLASLSNLQTLNLAHNDLDGEIPAALANLPNLQTLYLDGNDFEGCIPVALRSVSTHDLDHLGLPYCDVVLSGLSVSPWALEPAFQPHRTRYSAEVYDTQVTIAPLSDHGASFVYYVGTDPDPATDADASAPGFQVDLACGETEVEVEVISADNRADHTYRVEFESADGGAPAAPAISRVSGGTGSLTVNWNAPETADCGGDIDGYTLRHSLDEDGADWTEVDARSSSHSHTIRGLSSGTTYWVQVRAVNQYGDGAWSETVTGAPGGQAVTAPPGPNPQPPTISVGGHIRVRERSGTAVSCIDAIETRQDETSVRSSTVDATAIAGQDYESVSATMTLPFGWGTRCINVQIIDDAVVEHTEETYRVLFEPLAAYTPPLRVGIQRQDVTLPAYQLVTIEDDDLALVGFSDDEHEAAEGSNVSICLVVVEPVIVSVPFSVQFSYADPDGALATSSTIPSSASFGASKQQACFTVQTAEVSADSEVVFTLTGVTSRAEGVAARIALGGTASRTSTLKVLNSNP